MSWFSSYYSRTLRVFLQQNQNHSSPPSPCPADNVNADDLLREGVLIEKAAFADGKANGFQPSLMPCPTPFDDLSLLPTPAPATLQQDRNTSPPPETRSRSPSCSATSSISDTDAAQPGRKRRRGPRSHGAGRNANNKARGRKNRKKARLANSRLKLDADPPSEGAKSPKPFRFSDAEVVAEKVDTSVLPTAATGYVGRTGDLPPPGEVWLKEVVGDGSTHRLKLIPALEAG